MNEVGEIRFADGNVTGATRVGHTVRRRPGPWTPGVHALLRHLERAGFDGAPRPLGFDARGREILTYIDGSSDPDPRLNFGGDKALANVARLLRRYHDATTSFVPPKDVAWRVQVGAPTTGDVICHNDIAPWNTIVAEGQVVAFIDWDFAAPGPRLWDIAHALWRFVPLYEDRAFGDPDEQARRMRVFRDAYGLVKSAATLLDTITRRQQALHDTVTAWAADGEPAFVALWRDGHAEAVTCDMAYLRRHRPSFERALVMN